MNKILVLNRFGLSLALFFFGCWISLPKLAAHKDHNNISLKDPLYLPSLEGIRFLSFGYSAMVSDAFWLNTVSYFGKHYATDQNYRWLHHMCNLVFELNPRVYEPYYFCATMMAWEIKDHSSAINILTKAIVAHPNDWYFPYQRGFYRMYFAHDTNGAKEDFIKSSKLPAAHPIAARLAAKTISELEEPTTAISFISELIERNSDPHQRSALEERLKELYLERDLALLEKATKIFTERYGRVPSQLQELVEQGIVNKIPIEPFGADYVINQKDGSIVSSSGRKRLHHYGAK